MSLVSDLMDAFVDWHLLSQRCLLLSLSALFVFCIQASVLASRRHGVIVPTRNRCVRHYGLFSVSVSTSVLG